MCISHPTTATVFHMLVQELFLKSNSCSWWCQKELVAEWEKNNFCPLEDDRKRKSFSLLSSDQSQALPKHYHAWLQHRGKHFFSQGINFSLNLRTIIPPEKNCLLPFYAFAASHSNRVLNSDQSSGAILLYKTSLPGIVRNNDPASIIW